MAKSKSKSKTALRIVFVAGLVGGLGGALGACDDDKGDGTKGKTTSKPPHECESGDTKCDDNRFLLVCTRIDKIYEWTPVDCEDAGCGEDPQVPGGSKCGGAAACTDGATRCQGADQLQTCQDGRWESQSCAPETCVPNTGAPASAACGGEPTACTHGETRCVGNVLGTCLMDSWNDQDCGTDTCGPASVGSSIMACMPPTTCVHGETRCEGNVLGTCLMGTWTDQDCGTDICKLQANSTTNYACVEPAPVCTAADLSYCSGNTLRKCVNEAWADEPCGALTCGPVAPGSATMACRNPAVCTTGQTTCAGTLLSACIQGAWQSMDCAPRQCGALANQPTMMGCIDGGPKPELAACTPGRDTCATGLVCHADLHLCVRTCGPALPTCGTGWECMALTATATEGVCMALTAQRDQTCYDNGRLCAAEQGECEQVAGDAFACKLGCESNAIGTVGTCPQTELCLASPTLVEPQSPERTCTQPNTVDVCDGANGFACVPLSDGQNLCARSIGWCGTPVPMLGLFTRAGATAHADAGNTCDMVSAHKGCGVTGATAAAADSVCVDLPASLVGRAVSMCVGFCAGADGADLDCGTGYQCKRPEPSQAFYFDIQQNGATPLTCPDQTDAACNTAAGYHCIGPFTGGQWYCAQTDKVCVRQP